MVETITPVVYGRRSIYVASVALHALSATVTAAATGAVLATVGLVLGAPWGGAGALVVAAVAAVYFLREALRVPVPLPEARRQVPEWWRTFFAPPVAASLYGAGLGVAFLTFLGYGTFVAVATGAIVSADPIVGAALSAPFGLARAASIAVVGWRSTDPTATVSSVSAAAASPIPRLLNAAGLAAVGVAGVVQTI